MGIKKMLQAAINGNRSFDILPGGTDRIIQEAASAVKAGADSIHFHVRDKHGRESLRAEWVDEQILAIRSALPAVPVGISTGVWIEPDLAKRVAQIAHWNYFPDFVSVNFDEPGHEEIARAVLDKQIKIEAGICHVAAANNLMQSGWYSACERILIEPQAQSMAVAVQTIQDIENILNSSAIKIPRLLHGVDNTCWKLLKMAFQRSYAARIGFEDTVVLPNRRKAKSNAELVNLAIKIRNGLQVS